MDVGSASAKISNGALGPQAGSHFLEGDVVEAFEVGQTVDVSGDLDLIAMDAGGYALDFTVYQANGAGDTVDQRRVRLEFLDAADTLLATGDTGLTAYTTAWVANAFAGVPVPAGTRKVHVWLDGMQDGGSVANAAFDSLSGLFRAPEVTREFCENRINKCAAAGTTAAAQPVYDTAVGQQTTDGTAVFETEQAWAHHGAVSAAVDRTTFDTAIDEPRAADGWFAGGVLTWQSGANAGRSCEAREWIQASGRITLFLPQP